MEDPCTASYEAVEVVDGEARRVKIDAIRDRKIELYVNGRLAASIVSSPEFLEALACGYMIGEGIAFSAGDIESVEVKGSKVYARVKPGNVQGFRPRGALDVKSLFHCVLRAMEFLPSLGAGEFHFSIIFSAHGGLISYAIDVDRHGALWKAAGKAISTGLDLSDSLAICSGRVDSAMVRAACSAGISAIITPASPTDKAVESARREGITIMRFEGPARASVYCDEGSLSGMEFFRDRTVELLEY